MFINRQISLPVKLFSHTLAGYWWDLHAPCQTSACVPGCTQFTMDSFVCSLLLWPHQGSIHHVLSQPMLMLCQRICPSYGDIKDHPSLNPPPLRLLVIFHSVFCLSDMSQVRSDQTDSPRFNFYCSACHSLVATGWRGVNREDERQQLKVGSLTLV